MIPNKKKLSIHGFNLIEYFECGDDIDKYLTAYQCPAGKWTIGIGNTTYANGEPVKEGDTLTHQEAIDLFYAVIPRYEAIVNEALRKIVKQCQFDALVSFVYNVPRYAFTTSTLLRLINDNPDDVNIRREWGKWIYFTNPKTGEKEVAKGLVARRQAEVELYFGF